LEAVKKFGEEFDTDPTLDGIDISLPGAWGEGYKLAEYPENTLERIVDVYTSTFKHTQLIGQASRPELIRYGERTTLIGWRGDGLGEPEHTFEKYPDKVKKIDDVWKKAPVSFESYWWLCEWQRQGWDIDRIIESTLSWHLSSFNTKSMPIPMEWKETIDNWVAKMGYHYTVRQMTAPVAVTSGDEFKISLQLANVGVAPIYKPLGVYIRLRSGSDVKLARWSGDLRELLPGEYELEVPFGKDDELAPGDYSVEIAIHDGKSEWEKEDSLPFVYLATDAPRNGAYYTLGKITVK
jgi:hypothetical protein